MMQGKCFFEYLSTNILRNSSVSFFPNGWTDQELGTKWLEKDFEPETAARNISGGYRLLILDGHNSHCTLHFCQFAEKHRIIILCLPSHTTHALQPCDVAVFSPLASLWKAEVNAASRKNTPIDKHNFLSHYHAARTQAFQPETIQAAFRKTVIYPFNPNAINPAVFEPSKNTTTQPAQPLPAQLPSILTPIPPEPSTSTIPQTNPAVDLPSPTITVSQPNTTTEATDVPSVTPNPLPTPQYHIELPPKLSMTASCADLLSQNNLLRDLLQQAGIQLEQSYAQMKLMDAENGRLREQLMAKSQKHHSKKIGSSHARHMTSAEQLNELALLNWKKKIAEVHSEVKEIFRKRYTSIVQYYKDLVLEQKEQEAEERQKARDLKKATALKEKEDKAAEKRRAGVEKQQEKQAEKLWKKEVAQLMGHL